MINKKSILSVSIFGFFALVSEASEAFCFNFINGKGPSQVGSVHLAAQAKAICVHSVTSLFGKQSVQVEFSDSQGGLAIAGAELVSTGRCLGQCQMYSLTHGNSNGVNVDFSGTALELKAEPNANIGILTGVVTISNFSSVEKFLISEKNN